MDKHEARVRELAKHPMVGMRFAGIILRWEQNHEEPPPTESVANSTCVARYCCTCCQTDDSDRNGNSTRRWGSGRHMDAEEEDYFNSADDETVEVPLKWAPVQIPPMNTLKRKRRGASLGARGRTSSDGSGSTPAFQPIKPPSAGLLGLADYDEEEDDLGAATEPSADSGALPFPGVLSPSPMSIDATSPSSSSSSPKESSPGAAPGVDRKLTRSAAFIADSATAARLAEMQTDDSDDQPDVFPSLLEGGPPPLAQLRAEKRRREEEEDELLALYSNGKRAMSVDSIKASAGSSSSAVSDAEEETFPLGGKLTGGAESGAKKIKLSLGKGAAAVAAGSTSSLQTPAPSASSSTTPPMDSGGG